MPADTDVVLISPDHRRHGIPANDGLNSALHLPVSGVGHFGRYRNRIQIRRVETLPGTDATVRGPVQQQVQQLIGAFGAAGFEHFVKRFQPFGRFLRIGVHQDFYGGLSFDHVEFTSYSILLSWPGARHPAPCRPLNSLLSPISAL